MTHLNIHCICYATAAKPHRDACCTPLWTCKWHFALKYKWSSHQSGTLFWRPPSLKTVALMSLLMVHARSQRRQAWPTVFKPALNDAHFNLLFPMHPQKLCQGETNCLPPGRGRQRLFWFCALSMRTFYFRLTFTLIKQHIKQIELVLGVKVGQSEHKTKSVSQ